MQDRLSDRSDEEPSRLHLIKEKWIAQSAPTIYIKDQRRLDADDIVHKQNALWSQYL